MNKTERLKDLLRDKTLMIVGGANAWDKNRQQAFDVIVRINYHYKRQGGRVDGLYSGPGLPLEDSVSPRLFFSYSGLDSEQIEADDSLPLLLPYYPEASKIADLHGADNVWLNDFMLELETLPTTGILAIKQMSLMPVRAIRITGFDFWATQGVIPLRRGAHELGAQVVWLERLAMTDSRVTLDDNLSTLLSNYRFANVHQVFDDAGNVIERSIQRIF